MLRRKRIPAHLHDAFAQFSNVLAEVESGKSALAAVMPTTRLPGAPLPDALLEFEERLGRALERMDAWRAPVLEQEWSACRRATEESLARARRFREEAPDLGGFEGLIWAVEQLMAPLEAYHAAAVRFRALRTSPK